MHKIMRSMLLVFVLVLLIPGKATSENVKLVNNYVPSAGIVGEGRLSFMFWDVYDAALYAPKGEFKEVKKGHPFALSLTYMRDLKGRDIADRSVQEMRALGFSDEVTLAAWHSQMRQIFPDVSEGVTLTGFYTADGESVFYRDYEEIGRVSNPDFGKYFFNIWLDPRTSAPELRAKLLGYKR